MFRFKRLIAINLSVAMGLVVALTANALSVNERVSNFRLFDQSGGSHELHYFSDKKAVVLAVQDLSCPASIQSMNRAIARVRQHAEDVELLIINSTSPREAVTAAHSGEARILIDDAQLVGRTLDLSRAGEVLIIDPTRWTLAYRGDAEAGLDQALTSVVSGEQVATNRTQAPGCDVVFAPSHGETISYAQTIAPILSDNCVSCHRPGGIGPWAMTDYNMVRGFSLMMREVLLTQRMPPWHADPTVGHWANDRSISREELKTLVSWIDAGAPRGEGEDPLPQYAVHKPVWGELGEPDLILDIPPTDVPATGVVDYQYKYVTNPLDEDVWVSASQIVPGDRTVLHHVITRFGEMETQGARAGRLKRRSSIGGGLAGYVPGRVARPLPEKTGTLLPAGATIEFQMHYTTSGAATTDHSRIGIYFHNEAPEHRINSLILSNGQIKIPAYAKNHAEQAVRKFDSDVLVYSLLPHSHFRGKAAKFVAHYPNGTSEVLLNVPNYDFNWQTTYLLQAPKFMPAGTRIVYTNWWDNSAQNPSNPNPAREVRWGQQSFDEMIFGAIAYRKVQATENRSLAGAE